MSTRNRVPRKAALLALVCLLLPPLLAAQRGALVMSRNIGELAQQAATIVRGRVLVARVEPHPTLRNTQTVVVTVKVAETLKGSAADTFTFRQFVWDIRDRIDAAGYQKGQQVLLLMNAPTEYGLSSPAGLEQGRFRIQRDAQGRELAVNGRGNLGLFRNVPTLARAKGVRLSPRAERLVTEHRHGAVPLDDLREIVKKLGGTN